jgi:hypothetical protein
MWAAVNLRTFLSEEGSMKSSKDKKLKSKKKKPLATKSVAKKKPRKVAPKVNKKMPSKSKAISKPKGKEIEDCCKTQSVSTGRLALKLRLCPSPKLLSKTKF